MSKQKLLSGKRYKILIVIVTAIIISFLFPKGESLESEVTVGSIWIQEDLIASFSFPIIKQPETYKRELEKAKSSIYPVFISDNTEAKNIFDSLDQLEKQMREEFPLIRKNKKNLADVFSFLSENTKETFFSLSEKNFSHLHQYFADVRQVLVEMNQRGLLNLSHDKIPQDIITIRTGNIDRIDNKFHFLNRSLAAAFAEKYFNKKSYRPDIKRALIELTNYYLVPNLKFSQRLTDEELEIIQHKVSKYAGIVNEYERIIAKHDRINAETKLKIDSYKIAKGEVIGDGGLFLQWLGKFLHILSILILPSIYIYLFRKGIYLNNLKITVFAILILWVALVTFLFNQISIPDAARLLIFIPTVSMLMTIIFDSRVGFYSTIITSLICGALRGNDYPFVIMNIIAGVLSVYSVRDIKNRTQIFRSFLFILLGYAVTIIAFGFERFESWQKIIIEFSFAGTNALISPILTYGLLIFFERIFKITTDLTLLELSNFDRPLLKDLARKAPGSFNHSLTMGTLAEAAAEVVGANPLLARVGAYYHDIGKTISPSYFVENQLTSTNIHEEISPEESARIISDHVLQGIEIAKEDQLPQEIIDFIPQHHGTTMIKYFYDKAIKLYGEDKVDAAKYRYPGPKPQSKETAIVMLADTCESAVRSIPEPDIEKVENLISNLINDRINDKQLDESPLTFGDIRKIKEIFGSILLGQHHRRIRYPKQEEMEKSE
ncbi:MAG: HDIG domain-containing protein [Ignavibacteriaceae bacterium]|nr:HDIG domain-containing protein [Ignavibacteriaceae bacterium]